MKKFIPLMIVLAIIVSASSLFAAGNKEDSSAAGQKKVALTMWMLQETTPHIQSIRNSIAEFEAKNPSVTIALETITADAWYSKTMAAMQAGNLPDIMYLDSINKVSILYGKGVLEPVDDMINTLGRKEFSERTLSRYTTGGSIWSVPDLMLYQAVFYRKDLFAKKGITEFPQTWKELLEVAKKLTIDENGDGVPEVYGMAVPLAAHMVADQTYGQYMYGNGVHVFNPETGKYEFGMKKEEAIQALDAMIEMYKAASPPSSINWSWGDYRNAFVQGKTAMSPGWGAEIALAQEGNPAMLDNIGIFPFPAGPSYRNPADTVGDAKSISLVKSSNPARVAASKEFLLFLMQPERMANRANTRPVFAIPAMTSSFNSAEYQSNPMVKKFAAETKMLFEKVIPYTYRTGGEGGLHPAGGSIEATDVFGSAIHNVILRKWTSRNAVNWIDEQIRDLLEE